MSRPHNLPDARLSVLAWAPARVVEALHELGRHAGLKLGTVDCAAPPSELMPDQWNTFLRTAASRAGIQAEQVFVALDEIDALLSGSGPALLRLTGLAGAPFLAVVGARGHMVRVLGPDLRVSSISANVVKSAVLAPFEESVEGDLDRVLDRMALTKRQRAKARAAMLMDRLRPARFRGCWLVRLPPGAPVREHIRESGFAMRVALMVGAHLGQYFVFIASWWLLGSTVLQGTTDRGWFLGWALLLLSLIPLRLLGTWTQGRIAVSMGAWIRRRLLRGAFAIERQEIRTKGAGQLFGLVIEAGAIDALAVTGAMVAALALFEVAMASAVLWAGAGALAAPLLVGWAGLAGYMAWRYYTRRRHWTQARFGITERLVESMVGHRTQLVQQPPHRRHEQEDDLLGRYLEHSERMDDSSHWLTTIVPRGWVALALIALMPALTGGFSPTALAISIGGVLLAYRSLQRLVAGLSNLTGAVVASQSLVRLAAAAARTEPESVAASTLFRPSAAETLPVVTARDLHFQYQPQGDAVIRGCDLTIARGARVLLEGPSGSGKTTLASVLAGLESSESGLLLLDGLDRSVLGTAGWRSRVTMAPQAHDNYIVGGSLAFNLLMGRNWPPDRTDLDEADRVCRELGLGDLLDRLPSGLHQMVGETGWQLSQGERVRVFLARALLQRPELLVLDESFSALDPENVERAVRCVMTRADSVLAIAHP